MNTQLNTLTDNIQSEERSKHKIILKTIDKIHLVKISEIIYCESDANYTSFYLLNGSKIVISVTLKEYDEMLSDYGFFRVHKSFLINLIHIDCFDKADGGSVILANDCKVPVATRKRDQLLELFDRISGG